MWRRLGMWGWGRKGRGCRTQQRTPPRAAASPPAAGIGTAAADDGVGVLVAERPMTASPALPVQADGVVADGVGVVGVLAVP
ncbi:hypothetical protein PR202_ga04721 [Eleusine coracana subsp. coracana]|uniref:Uncharacterized protein n=1 Tax=Eleusine coracana subsp. coracana TaxID=191504 RepID=A0AAV5BQB4_ELECO|nr:hypothetical protein PR202_ga04721 [Eleusine coracana subsp. coracana]